MRTICLLSALLACACGKVASSDGGADAGGDSDTTAPRIMSTSPADSADLASVIAPIRIVMDEPIDPTTVNDDTIVVTGPAGALLGSVSYDDNTIVFSPALPLAYAGQYSVTVGMVSDPTGNVFEGTEFSFSTFVNDRTRETRFDAQGTTQRTEFERSDDDNMRRTDRYSGPGLDGQWFTDDDTQDRLSISEYDGEIHIRTSAWTDAGTDGEWGTADDASQERSSSMRDSLGRGVKTTYGVRAGPDGQWDTADDTMNLYITLSYETTAAEPIGRIHYNAPGTDGLWDTADDPIQRRYTFEYHANGKVSREATYTGGSSVPTSYSQHKYDSNGARTESTFFTAPGDDGQWFTSDDPITSYSATKFDANGLTVSTTNYRGPGDDGVWKTSDDEVTNVTLYDHDANRQLSRITHFSNIGSDGIVGTADDAVAYYRSYEHDALGNRVRNLAFTGPGQDGMWFTADDVKQNRTTYDTTH